MKTKRAKRVGIWVVAVTKQQQLIKWGQDGDSVHPFKNIKAAKKQAEYLSESECHIDDVFYYLFVFDNGQMKQYECFEDSHAWLLD